MFDQLKEYVLSSSVFLLDMLQHSQIAAVTMVCTMLFLPTGWTAKTMKIGPNLYETIILL